MLVAQSSDSLWSHGLQSPPDSPFHGIFQARILEWVTISISRGIFLTQEFSLGLQHYRQILYHLRQQGSPKVDGSMHLNSVFFLKPFLRHNLQNKLQRSTAQLTYTHEIVTTINIINIFITFKLFCVTFINPCFDPHQSHFLTQPFMYFLLL